MPNSGHYAMCVLFVTVLLSTQHEFDRQLKKKNTIWDSTTRKLHLKLPDNELPLANS